MKAALFRASQYLSPYYPHPRTRKPTVGMMTRWGGKPYWDGQFWRCPDCNGLINSTGTCSTCLRVPDRTNGRNSWSGRERR